MAPKAHRAGAVGLPRAHSRSSSTGSSKVALDLHFTQKDHAPPRQPEKTRKAGHGQESRSRNTSPLPRVNSTARVASREHIQAHRYAPPLTRRQQGGKTKAGFTLASPPADDDDEWVSSESGVATPNSPGSSGQTPVDQRKSIPTGPPVDDPVPHPDTPRAQSQSLSRVPTIRAPEAPAKTSVSAARGPPASQTAAAPPSSQTEPASQTQTQLPLAEPHVMETRSANTSPVHRMHHSSSKRLSVTRPPSMHSTTSRSEVPLRPHPLIRGQSFGQGVPMTSKVVPLAPLTVTSEASPVSSPSRDQTEKLSTSPSSVKTTYAESVPNRRTSVSSVRSVATLPNQPHIQTHFLSRAHGRHRTLSSISSNSSSSVQALSSLYLPTTRPSTPQYTAHFPPASISLSLEAVHPLLPPPYLSAHMSILTHRSPLKESYDRVIAARELQKREGGVVCKG